MGAQAGVLLVNLPDPWRENLGLGYLAASLQQRGCRVEIFEPHWPADVPGEQESAYVPQILEKEFAILGISLYTPGVAEAIRLTQAVRALKPEAHICLGGNLATVAYGEILADPDFREVDSVVLCEGEQTFTELVTTVGDGGGWREVPGLAYRQGDAIVTSPARALADDLDALPFPVRVGKGFFGQETAYGARLCSSRGCYGRCSFCSVPAFYAGVAGRTWRGRSATNVVDEMEYLLNEAGVSSLEFVDDNFLGPGRAGKARAKDIAREIKGRGLDLSF